MELQQPEISVIVPTYNLAPYLAACLDSLLAQTFRAFEIVVVDDASTDDTLEVLRAYAERDARVRICCQRWNHGVAASYNFGLACSRGTYVAFVDADDVVVPEYLATLHHVAELTGADVVAAGYQEFCERPGDGEVVSWTQEPGQLGETAEERLAVFLPGLQIHIAPWGKLYKKAFLDAHRIAFDSPSVAPDVTFHLACLLAAEQYVVLPQHLYHYRTRGGSVEHAPALERAEQYAQVLPVLMNAFASWLDEEWPEPCPAEAAKAKRQALQHLYVFLMWNVQRSAQSCDRHAVARAPQQAMEQTPSHALQTAMIAATLREPFTRKYLDVE